MNALTIMNLNKPSCTILPAGAALGRESSYELARLDLDERNIDTVDASAIDDSRLSNR